MTKERRKSRAVVEDRVEIGASPEIVWTCFAELGRWPQWFPALEGAEWIGGTPWTMGAQFRQTIQWGFPLGKVTPIATITEISPSPYVAWEGKVAGMELVQGFRFDPIPDGTEVLVRHEFYGPLALMARLLLLNRRVHGIYQAALAGLKSYVETGTVQPKTQA